ncbi:MAG: porin [Armatimonadetes bacterium]|nr:porin [Armatimonadota bacterium]
MKKLVGIILLVACACTAFAQAPSDVPRDHWAYEAVRDLVEKGYMEGYTDGRFLGNRNMTRYEFATVVKRLLDGLEARIAAIEAKAGDGQRPTSDGVKPGQQEVSKADLEQIRKLVEEFKPELAVIGARLDKVEAKLEEFGLTIKNLDAILTDPEGAFEAMKSDVSKLKKVTVSGYVQARYSQFQGDPNSATSDRPPANFSVRRARIKVTGKPTDNSVVVIQLDGGQNYTGAAAPSVTVRDAYLEYNFAGDPAFGLSMQMGQMKWPFGYEVVQSSAVRESPERSLIVQRLFPGERDRGFCLGFPMLNDKLYWKFGVFNGVQITQTPQTNNKAAVASVRVKLGDIDFGASAWYGKNVLGKDGKLYYGSQDPKTRYGADIQWYMSNLSIKAEYITGVGVDGADSSKSFVRDVLYKHIDGGWAQIAWNPTPADTIAIKYETMSEDPLYPKFGRRSSWNLGYLRWLDEKTRIKFYYIINQEEKHSFGNDAAIFEWITTF